MQNPPKWEYYRSFITLPVWKLVALLCNIEPLEIEFYPPGDFSLLHSNRAIFLDRLNISANHLKSGEIQVSKSLANNNESLALDINIKIFISWVKLMDWENIPPEFFELGRNSNVLTKEKKKIKETALRSPERHSLHLIIACLLEGQFEQKEKIVARIAHGATQIKIDLPDTTIRENLTRVISTFEQEEKE